MTIHEARLIKQIKSTGWCTYRALAEMYYPPGDPLKGNQLAGQDLCREAAEILGMHWEELDPSSEEQILKNRGWYNREQDNKHK